MMLASGMSMLVLASMAMTRPGPVGSSAPPAPVVTELLVLHVDDDAPDGGDGMSWQSAFTHLQDALALARTQPSVKEIRVARGLYKADHGEGFEPGDIYASFELVDGVALRGGYAGLGAPDPDARNFESFASILSGDLLGDDLPDFGNVTDNTYRILTSAGVAPPTLLEGFFVTASQWNGGPVWVGGGLYCLSGALTVQDCVFHRCLAYRGGGIGVVDGVVIVRRCIFRFNEAYYAAGMSTKDGAPGARPSVLIEDCVFADNRVDFNEGGGLSAEGRTLIRRCLFIRNWAGNHAGAIDGSPMVEDCHFIENHASWSGGAVDGTGIYRRCLFQDNSASIGGGATVGGASFIDCTFRGNVADGSNGGAAAGGAAFINCRFIGNESGWPDNAHGGAIHVWLSSLIANCTFSGNQAGGAGGAVRVPPDATALVVNCTFTGNESTLAGSALEGPAEVVNSIIWNHAGEACSGLSSVSYSCVPSSCSELGPGNIVGDPLFVDADGLDDDLRLAPGSPCIDAGDSTALPADMFDLDGDGDLAEPLPLDLRGSARMLDLPAAPDTGAEGAPGAAVVDMGATEHRRRADVAPPIGDGAVNVDDLLALLLTWGPCPQPAPGAAPACLGDIDGDGQVGVGDLVIVLTEWD